MNEPKLRELLKEMDVHVVTRTGDDWLLCHCPFAKNHAKGTDRNPSFMVSIRQSGRSGFNCWSCKAHGNLGRLIRGLEREHGENYQHLYTKAVLDELPGDFGEFELESPELEEVPHPLNPVQFEGMFLPAWEDRTARRFLTSRGVSERTTRKLGLLFDEDEDRVLFPIYGASKDELYGFSGRTILPDKEAKARGVRYGKVKDYAGLKKRHRILGQHLWKKGLPVLIQEGLMGYAHLHEIGADKLCNVGALLGSVLYMHQRDILLEHDASVYLCLDDDPAGDIGLFGPLRGDKHEGGGAIDLLKDELPVHLVYYPKGIDDIDDFTLEHVRTALRDRNLCA